MTILVTGGAGYIGSHAVRALQRAGYRPVVLDNLVYGHRQILEQVLHVPLVVGQVGDRILLDQLLRGEHPATGGDLGQPGEPVEAVLHFAAYAYVGESVADPAKYYRNNSAIRSRCWRPSRQKASAAAGRPCHWCFPALALATASPSLISFRLVRAARSGLSIPTAAARQWWSSCWRTSGPPMGYPA